MNTIPQTVQLIIASFSTRKWCWNLNKWFREHLCDVATFEDFCLSSMHIHYVPVYCWSEMRVLSHYQILPNYVYEMENEPYYLYIDSDLHEKHLNLFTDEICYISHVMPEWFVQEIKDLFIEIHLTHNIIKLEGPLTNEIMDRDISKYHNKKNKPVINKGVFEPWFIEKYWENIIFCDKTIIPSNILVEKWMKHLKQFQRYDFRKNGFSLDKHHINNLQYDKIFDFSLCGLRIIFNRMPQNLSWLIACVKYIQQHNDTSDKKKKLICDYYDWIPDNVLTKYKEIITFNVDHIKLFSLPIRFNDLDWQDEHNGKQDNAGIYFGLITKQDYIIYKQSNPEIYNILYDDDKLNYKITEENLYDLCLNEYLSSKVKHRIFVNNNINLPLHLFHKCMYMENNIMLFCLSEEILLS